MKDCILSRSEILKYRLRNVAEYVAGFIVVAIILALGIKYGVIFCKWAIDSMGIKIT